jgi:acyl-CoA thioesterase II
VISAAGTAFSALVNEVLVVEPCGLDRFVGTRPAESFDRVYGGEVAAQGLQAAAGTVDPVRRVHSLHVSFLGIGDPTQPVVYAVQRLRDSSQFSTRLVISTQRERPIATSMVSFQVPRQGFEHTVTPVAFGNLPSPESLPTRGAGIAAAFGDDLPANARIPWPIDIRYIDHEPWSRASTAPTAPPASNRLWLRGDGALGDDPLAHAGVLAYASDLTMFEPVIAPHGGAPYFLTWGKVQRGMVRGASLDHALWFHRPFRADEWLLHEQDSPVAHGSRGLTTGRFFTANGQLVASVAQEIVILVDPEAAGGRGGD